MGVIRVTAIPAESPHTGTMQRQIDEAEYVLAVLYQVRDEVSTNPELFDPDAQKRIDETSARVQDLLQSTRSELIKWNVVHKVKAA